MEKEPLHLIIRNSASNRSSAMSANGDVNELQILIHYTDGSAKEIFKGKHFSEVKLRKKASNQQSILSEFYRR